MNKRALSAIAFAFLAWTAGFLVTFSFWGAVLWAILGAGLGLALVSVEDRLGIVEYAWRLIPANPILLRVVESGGRRKRDLFIRCGYLALMIVVAIISLVQSQGSLGGGLGALAKVSAQMFEFMSYAQLALVALLAPIFTAGAITQEKDSQTYDILLATPLTNGQIVLGSLLSRLFFVIALLISGIPIFSMTQIFGGVAIKSIALSFAIAAATAFVTGAMAMAIATFKVGTRRTIFSFYLFIVLYLVGFFLLDRLPFFHPVTGIETDGSGQPVMVDGKPKPRYAQTSYFTPLHPFLSLRVIFNDPDYTPPAFGDLSDRARSWPIGWALSRPQTFYPSLMFFLSFMLVAPSIVLLRRVAQSTISVKSWLLQRIHLSSGDRRRKPRTVWSNPIAWREAKTKASAARATLLRYGFIIAGVVAAILLVILYATKQPVAQYVSSGSYDPVTRKLTIFTETSALPYTMAPTAGLTLNGKPISPDQIRGRFKVDSVGLNRNQVTSLILSDIPRGLAAQDARNFLLGAVIVEFAVILLIVTNAAASTVTREKEDGTLDLLLTTPITSRYYIWGKLRGLVSYVLPLVAVPVASILVFVIYDFFAWIGSTDAAEQSIVFPESVLILPGSLVIVVAFASILGMHMSLRCRTTVMAVMSSVGIVVGVSAALGWCGVQFLGMRSSGLFALMISSFSPFTVLTVLINPYQFGGDAFSNPDEFAAARSIIFVCSWLATAGYAMLVWTMYKSMVYNFDMTIRKQTR